MGSAMSNPSLGGGAKKLAFPYSLPSPRSSSFSADDNTGIHNECRTLVLSIKGHPDKKKRLLQLEGEDAQRMVDFLCKVSHEKGILDNGRFVLSRLRDLAKKNEVFPYYYKLTGIESDFQTIHGGTFADVCRGEYKSQQLGLKMIRIFGEQDKVNVLKTFVKELALWAHLSHTNILPFHGVYLQSEAKRICLVSPWMKNGNLRDHLQRAPETPRLPLISDIVEGLYYLHGQKIVHGDLKSMNVLISDDGRALIGDFGLSYIAVASGMVSSSGLQRGTTRWTAPELLRNNAKQTMASDMWSLGCSCYEVLTRKLPFHDLTEVQVILLLVQEGNHTPHLPNAIDIDPEHDKVDDQIWETIKKCWNYEPSGRPTCDEVRSVIAGANILDARPKITTEAQDGLFFLQAMRTNSDPQIDYSRVLDILRKIHQTGGQEID